MYVNSDVAEGNYSVTVGGYVGYTTCAEIRGHLQCVSRVTAGDRSRADRDSFVASSRSSTVSPACGRASEVSEVGDVDRRERVTSAYNHRSSVRATEVSVRRRIESGVYRNHGVVIVDPSSGIENSSDDLGDILRDRRLLTVLTAHATRMPEK